MIHRHLEIPPGTATEDLPSAAIVDLLERGDIEHWQPIAAAVAREPLGEFANRVARLIDRYPIYGISPLWRTWIARVRDRAKGPLLPPQPIHPAELRRRRGLTQVVLAARMGMTQSDLSKFERRRDVRLSTLRGYLEAMGAELRIVSETELGGFEILW